jgi:hypothetical protein
MALCLQEVPLVKAAKILLVSLGRFQLIRATWKRIALVAVPAIAVATVAAQADPTLTVTNGEFLQYSGTTPGTNGDSFNNVNPTGWTAGNSGPGGSLIFITTANGTQQVGVNDPNLYLPVYGPTTGVTASPTNAISNPIPGSNFVEADANPFYGNSFSYQLSGLTVDQTYQLSFFEAFGQQTGFSGDMTNQWIVGLGAAGSQFVFDESNSSQYSYSYSDLTGSVTSPGVVNVPSGTFTGWQQVTVNLTADAPNDVLTFLAWGNNGSTANEPPIAFLDIGANGATASVPLPPASSGGPLLLVVAGMLGFGAKKLRSRRSNPGAV